MNFDDKEALRIERALAASKAAPKVGPTIGEQLIADLIASELQTIYNMQEQLSLAQNAQMIRMVCDCGHHFMAKVKGTIIEKMYPCTHCKKPMKGV